MRTYLIFLVFGLVATSCGSPSGKGGDDDVVRINNSDDGTNNNGTTEPGSQAHRVKAGLAVPETARSTGTGSVELLAEGVFLASELGAGGAQLVTTGTLTQQGEQLQFTYDPEPEDRLHVVWSEGEPTDFFVTTFEGDFSDDATTFVNSDHVVEFRIVSDGHADLQVSSRRANGQSSGAMQGTVTVDGIQYDVDLEATGTYSSQVEIESAEHESTDRYTGTIAGSDGFSIQVDESYRFKLLVFENGVTNEERLVNNTWSAGGNDYAVQDVRIRYETLNGWANVTDYWIAEGNVLENGEVVGQMTFEETATWISIYVALNDGEKVEVQRFFPDPN